MIVFRQRVGTEMPSQSRREALVRDLLAHTAEQPWLEFKGGNIAPDVIGRTISAVSNSAAIAGKSAGYVIWGVEDVLRAVIGTDFSPHQCKIGNQPLEIWLTQKLAPNPVAQFTEMDLDGRRLVIAEVPAASTSPVKYDGTAFVRVGSCTTRLSDHPNVEAQLWSKLQSFIWESIVAVEFIQANEVLDLLDYKSFFERLDSRVPDSPDLVLERLAADKLISPDVGGRWNILNLGVILIAHDLNRFSRLARKTVRVIQYAGKEKLDTLRRIDGKRGYATGFEGLVRSINGLLPKNEFIGEAFREERPMYPPIAIRETVANALIHQDMTVVGAGPLIEIYADRIEITNPGEPLVSPERMIDFPPRSRNEALAAIMRRMRICEEQGSGVDKIVRAVEVFQLPPPDFRTFGENMKVTLFGHRSFSEMEGEERVRAAYQHAVIRYLVNQRLTNSSLRQRLGIAERNAAQVTRIINDARDKHLIKLADSSAPRAGYIPIWA